MLTLAGLAVTAWLIGKTGAGQVVAATAAIGPIGFLLLCGYTLAVLVVLGAAWFAVAPGLPAELLPAFIWGRTTREAATDVLPFSLFGGLIVGGRTLAARGIRDSLIYASMIADLTTELAAQALFSLAGVSVLLVVLAHEPVGARLIPLAVGGLIAMIAIMAAFAFAQRPLLRLAEGLGGRLLPGSNAAMAGIRAELDAIYRKRARVLAGFLLNLVAWIASAAGAWIALSFMGARAPLWAIVTIEALIFTVRSVAFAIPGGIGVQETAYILIGPLFGLTPSMALALSLVKRARDLAIGVPAILIWQVTEYRTLASRKRGIPDKVAS
ncbi:MAG: flippase-like domain-containing protein [Sphingomonadaceae bacterium]|nr:flippase-like domain-containing protein [Sphingomonadaceae bacterium]